MQLGAGMGDVIVHSVFYARSGDGFSGFGGWEICIIGITSPMLQEISLFSFVSHTSHRGIFVSDDNCER